MRTAENIAGKIKEKTNCTDTQAWRMLAKLAGVRNRTALRWHKPRSAGGTDGQVPNTKWKTIIENSTKLGIPLSHDDFVTEPNVKIGIAPKGRPRREAT